MAVTDGFVDALVAAPVGVVLLGRLEARERHPERGAGAGYTLAEADPGAVAAAAQNVATMSFDDLAAAAVEAAVWGAGPWIGDAASSVAAAYRQAEDRVPIAEAIAGRFGSRLHEPIALDAQQWWTTADAPVAPLFWAYESVYGAGQFTWAGLWTVTDPSEDLHETLADVWELYGGPVSRWWFPVRPGARVFEVHRPEDWARLVMDHPQPARDRQESWELPGPNQSSSRLGELMAVTGQRAARTEIRRHLVPDWRSVATTYDGVHLSWAGFLTSEGCVTDLGDGDVAMLRYWFSERTHWLADVFGDPRPAPQPTLPGRAAQHEAGAPTPLAHPGPDLHALAVLLGRSAPGATHRQPDRGEQPARHESTQVEQRRVPLRHHPCGQPLVCPHCEQTIIVEYSTADFPDGWYALTIELPGSTSDRDHHCPACDTAWHHICDFSRSNPDRFLP